MTRTPAHTLMRRAVLSAVSVLVIASCGGGGESAAPTSVTPTTSANGATTVPVHGGAVAWTPCGAIECGQMTVPATHNEPAGSTIKVSVYRHVHSVEGDGLGTLVLIPDWSGWTARELAEKASIVLGSFTRSFDVVSMSPRGFFDSTPLPCASAPVYVENMDDAGVIAQKCTSDAALLATSYGTIEAAHDAASLVEALGVPQVKVIGWGRGATIATAWKLLHPGEISAAVLDSPTDPGISPVRVAVANRVASDAAVSAVMRWCTSHISCPFVENAGKRVGFVLEDIRDGKAGDTTEADFRMSFQKAMDDEDNGSLFRALLSAESDDFVPLRVFAALSDPSAADSFSARVAGECSDLAAGDIDTVINDDAEFEFTLFRVGLGMTVPRICQQMPEAPEPLGDVHAADGAKGALVQTYVAAGDGSVAPSMVAGLSKRLGWKHRAVPGARHLVVGIDRTTTRAVAKFLTGS